MKRHPKGHERRPDRGMFCPSEGIPPRLQALAKQGFEWIYGETTLPEAVSVLGFMLGVMAAKEWTEAEIDRLQDHCHAIAEFMASRYEEATTAREQLLMLAYAVQSLGDMMGDLVPKSPQEDPCPPSS